jgi:hypothetical protein
VFIKAVTSFGFVTLAATASRQLAVAALLLAASPGAP